jgi:glutamate formiminotransferase/formiminotetrahydrofolate cyclodeaminase
VVEAAFRAIARAAELIDMRQHHGAHPRMGATDVCPLVPISGVSDDEAVEWARKLARRVGEELHIPVYLYEKAASQSGRRNLAHIRAGEYEGFAEKIKWPEWEPDFGPREFNPSAGQTAIGVRDFLIAYNVNLNTQSVRRANSVAFDVREKGRVRTEDGKPWGKPVLGPDDEPERLPGRCKAVKGIGWYVEEYGIAQVSMNLTDINATPLHIAFDECVESANRRGLRVTGSELVGLVPKRCLLEAGRYFLQKQNRSWGISEEELLHLAVKSLGLDELKPFDPKEKVIEYRIGEQLKGLVALSLRRFADLLASESPAPGGGSVAALCGALAASLGCMVANLSANKRGWDERVPEFSRWAEVAQELKDELLRLVDEDTEAFSQVLEAYRLPKGSDEEQAARSRGIEQANQKAARVPARVMETAVRCLDVLEEMVETGNPSSVTDAGVGALCAHTAIEGAALNVRVNLQGITDRAVSDELLAQAQDLVSKSRRARDRILQAVESKL